jgi:hypothetical protein
MTGLGPDFVTAVVERADDLSLIAVTVFPVDLLVSVSTLNPDAVVVPLDDYGNFPGVCSHLHGERPDLTIIGASLAVVRIWSGTGEEEGTCTTIEYSAENLLAAIRGSTDFPRT